MRKIKKPSEIIEDFLLLIELSHEACESNEKAYQELDNNYTIWAHKFEFAKDKAERNKLGTAYQKERKKRREFKDTALLYESIHNFSKSENNKPCLRRLEGALKQQRRHENYLEGDRTCKNNREGETDDIA